MRTPLVAAVFALVVTSSNAVTAIGAHDCGQWFSRNSSARIWLMGYLSGLAAADPVSKIDVLDRLNSADQAFVWMDNYCKANPLKKVNDGAISLYLELQNQE